MKGYVFLFPFLNIPAFPTLGIRWMNEGVNITLTELIKPPERAWPGGPPRSGPRESSRWGRGVGGGGCVACRKEGDQSLPHVRCVGAGRDQRKEAHSQFLRDGLSPPPATRYWWEVKVPQEVRVLFPYLLHENPAVCPGARIGQWWQMTLGKSLESVLTSHS